MLTPEQLEQLPNNLVRLYAQLEEDILASMAARINARNLFIPATDWQFQKLAEMQNSYDDILKRLSDASGKTEAELRELMTAAASESLKYDDAIHRAAGKSLPPLNQSAALLATLQAGIKRTNGYFENLCRTTANQGSKQFANVLDRAYMQVVSGAFTKEQAIQMAVKDLASQGIHAAQYKNGRKMSLEAAVRMNIITGVNQTCAQLQLERADEAGCDLVEVSAHAGARPDHELWQGKIYSRSGEHPKYPDFVSSTGYGTVTGLCGVNCRHNFYPFYEGISKRAYTEKELEQMKARTVPYNGQMLTEYEASQVQRKIERNIRCWKREKAGMKAAGQSTAEAAAKLSHWRREMERFTRQTGFKRQYSREEIFAESKSRLSGKGASVTIKTRQAEQLAIENFPAAFLQKSERKNTQAFLNYVNNLKGADAKVIAIYNRMGRMESLERNGIPFKISHGKNHAVSLEVYQGTGELASVTLTIPKLQGNDLAGQINTILHESMHLIDLYNRKNITKGERWFSIERMSLVDCFQKTSNSMGDDIAKLFKAHDAQYQKTISAIQETYQQKISALMDSVMNKTFQGSFKDYKREYAKLKAAMETEMDYHGRNVMGGGIGNLEDIYDALSGGTFSQNGTLLYGHGQKYYSSVENRVQETIANYATLSVTRPDLIELLRADKPELAAELDAAITELLKRVGE